MADLPTSVEDTSHVEEKTVHQKRLPTEEECELLINAAGYGDMEVVTRLSNDGVDMDAIIHEEYQLTPLHVTASYGHDNIVKKLISLHVNIKCVDVKRWTPLHKAAKNGHNNLAILLLAANANVNCQEEITKGIVNQSFSSRSLEVLQIQHYKVATTGKLICTVTVQKINYRCLIMIITYDCSPLPR
ncbi:ankyrin repeat domain-containing protein 49-like isoform X2 [Dysidea avara]